MAGSLSSEKQSEFEVGNNSKDRKISVSIYLKQVMVFMDSFYIRIMTAVYVSFMSWHIIAIKWHPKANI